MTVRLSNMDDPTEYEIEYAKECLMDLGLTEDEAEYEVNEYYEL